MDLKVIKELVSKNLSSMIVVLIMFSSAFVFVWQKYDDVVKRQDAVLSEERALNDKKVAYEKYQLDGDVLLQKRALELDKREFILNELTKENEIQASTVKQSVLKYEDAFSKLQLEQGNVSKLQRIKEGEEKIQKLIHEYSSLGTDLNARVKCNDYDGQAKHEMAKVKYNEIVAISESLGFYNKFKSFFDHNGQWIFGSCI